MAGALLRDIVFLLLTFALIGIVPLIVHKREDREPGYNSDVKFSPFPVLSAIIILHVFGLSSK